MNSPGFPFQLPFTTSVILWGAFALPSVLLLIKVFCIIFSEQMALYTQLAHWIHQTWICQVQCQLDQEATHDPRDKAQLWEDWTTRYGGLSGLSSASTQLSRQVSWQGMESVNAALRSLVATSLHSSMQAQASALVERSSLVFIFFIQSLLNLQDP